MGGTAVPHTEALTVAHLPKKVVAQGLCLLEKGPAESFGFLLANA